MSVNFHGCEWRRCGVCGGVVLLGVVTVAAFARERYGVSIVDRAFGVRRDVLSGYYQDDLYSVCV
jgi:hypothetical protein